MTSESQEAPKPIPSKNPPALSASVPPPRSERIVSYVLVGILLAALCLALGGVIVYGVGAD